MAKDPRVFGGLSLKVNYTDDKASVPPLRDVANLTRLKMNLFDSICKIRSDLIK